MKTDNDKKEKRVKAVKGVKRGRKNGYGERRLTKGRKENLHHRREEEQLEKEGAEQGIEAEEKE